MIYSFFQNIYQESVECKYLKLSQHALTIWKVYMKDIDICKLTVKAMDEVQQYHFQLEHEENLNKKKKKGGGGGTK